MTYRVKRSSFLAKHSSKAASDPHDVSESGGGGEVEDGVEGQAPGQTSEAMEGWGCEKEVLIAKLQRERHQIIID